MRYVNAYPKFSILGIVYRLVFFLLIGTAISFQLIFLYLYFNDSISFDLFSLASLFLLFFILFVYIISHQDRFLIKWISVDIDENGLKERGLLRTRTVEWNKIKSALIVKRGLYRNRYLAIEDLNGLYIFHPFLIAEESNSFKVHRSFFRTFNYDDYMFGTTYYRLKIPEAGIKEIDLRDTEAYKILEKYRPDLVINIQLPQKPIRKSEQEKS